MTDLEIKNLVASLAVGSKKIEAILAETSIKIQATTDQQKITAVAIAETAAQQKLTEIQLAKTDAAIAETAAQQKLTEIQLAKTDAQLAKTDKKLNGVATMLGGIGNSQGCVAEEFFYNSLADNLTLNGIKFDFIDKNINRKKQGLTDEFDIVLVNGKEVFIIEVKYKVGAEDLTNLLTKKYPNFKQLYPEYQNYQHHLGLATFYINGDLKAEALADGINILQRKGKIIETTAA